MSDHHDELSCRRGQLNVVTIILESGQSELIWMALACMWPYALHSGYNPTPPRR